VILRATGVTLLPCHLWESGQVTTCREEVRRVRFSPDHMPLKSLSVSTNKRREGSRQGIAHNVARRTALVSRGNLVLKCESIHSPLVFSPNELELRNPETMHALRHVAPISRLFRSAVDKHVQDFIDMFFHEFGYMLSVALSKRFENSQVSSDNGVKIPVN